MQKYQTKMGEMWDSIAYKLYGDEKKATDIIAVNPRLADYISFTGKEVINLPDNVETIDTSTLAPWRR
jgi:phage tail protein X